jgi:PAS domain S-box-containing protein
MEEHAALRRVATLVAREEPAEAVFAAVAEEAGRLLCAQTANAYRFEGEAQARAVGAWSADGGPGVGTGSSVRLDGPTAVPLVFRRREPVRIDDYTGIEGEFAAYLRGLGIRSTVAAPIFLQGELWGALTASTIGEALLHPSAERQLAELADLLSQSLGNHEARRQLHAERDFANAVVELSQAVICVFDREGRIVRFNRAAEEVSGYSAEEIVGTDARDTIIPPEQRELFGEVLERAFTLEEPYPIRGWWVRKDGTRRTIEFTNRALTGADGAVRYFVSTGLDVTERERAAEQESALRRIATLVARGPEPEAVFEAVAAEAGRLLGAASSATIRFDGDEATTVGRWSTDEVVAFPVGSRVSLRDSDGLTAVVARTGQPARIDGYEGRRGDAAAHMRVAGYNSAVGAPIVVDGRAWGMVLVAGRDDDLGHDAEQRLTEFAELVALALESAQARTELTSSRARIVRAGDAERRRFERNLHDGAQQRLVTLSVQLRLARTRLHSDPETAEAMIAAATDELAHALEELRELARGLHPALLSERGLAPALEGVAARAPFPVNLASALDCRLPDPIEAALYYVASESLANAAKHAGAAAASIKLACDGGSVWIEIVDDGCGGADATGSGLQGLADRVAAHGGRLSVTSPPGAGTLIRAEIPLG